MAARLLRASKPARFLENRDETVVAATDPLGLQPLYYTSTDRGEPVVNHSIEQLLEAHPPAVADLNLSTVVGHIAGSYAPEPGSTFFKHIHAVAPGTAVAIEPEEVSTETYWDPLRFRPNRLLRAEEASRKLRDLLFEVIADYVPDVRVACTLSSGMDSSTVLAGLQHAGADVIAVTWPTPEISVTDESRWAKLTAEKLGVPLIQIPMTTDDLIDADAIAIRRATPLVNIFGGILPKTAKTLSQHGIGVTFTGFSGDHLFLMEPGPDLLLSFRLVRLARYLRNVSPKYPTTTRMIRRELLGPIGRQTLPRTWARRQQPVSWLHPDQHEVWRERLRRSLGPGILPGHAERIAGVGDATISYQAETLAYEMSKEGVEIRHPLMDRRIVEFALSLPTWLLDDGQTDKLVLRDAMRGVLPDQVVELEKIYPERLAEKVLRDRSQALMSLTKDMRAADLKLVLEQELSDYVSAFMRGEHDDATWWSTLTLEDWLRRWF